MGFGVSKAHPRPSLSICFCARPTRQQEQRCNRILLRTFIGRAWLQRWRDPNARTGAAYIGLGEACLTPDWLCTKPHLHVPHLIGYSLSLYLTEPHYHTHLHVSHLIGYTLKASLLCPGQAVSLQKTLLHMYTLVVCPNLCLVASSSQCHSATAHVASHSCDALFQDPVYLYLTLNKKDSYEHLVLVSPQLSSNKIYCNEHLQKACKLPGK